MTTLQKSLITTVIVAAVGVGIYEAREASHLREQVESLKQQQQSAPADQLQQLTSERDNALRELAGLREEVERLNRNSAELIRLRGEVGRLREIEREAEVNANSGQAEMKSWLARVEKLKKRLEADPSQKIPELRFVTERDWLDAAHEKLSTEKDFRQALSRLRRLGEGVFAAMLDSAFRKYMETNKGRFPNDVLELQGYFHPPIDAELLERYEVVAPRSSPDGKIIKQGKITTKFPIDEEFDARYTINPDGLSSSYPAWRKRTAESSDWEAISSAMDTYKAVYGIREPTDYSLLRPYATTPEQKAALEKIIQEMSAREKTEN